MTDFTALIAEVKGTANLIEICEKNGVKVTQTGYRYKALCPFHQENTPSFIIDDRSQTYHCFGCGEKGDVLNFIQQYNNTDFMDSLRIVGESYGIDIDTRLAEIYNDDSDRKVIDYKVLRSCIQLASEYYSDNFNKLADNHPAKKVLTDRNLNIDTDKVNVYLGYADKNVDSLVRYLTSKDYTEEEIIEAGLARKVDTKNGEKVFDVFSNRLLFAFTDQVGRIIGFSGRKLNDEDYGGKYVNTSETPLFHKGSLIYNFFNARKAIGKEQSVYIVEGQSDVMALQQSGLENVVAISGTAATEDHMKILNRSIGTNGKIIFCLDGDTPGLQAAKKTIEHHKIAQNKGYAVTFPPNEDPCSMYTDRGADGLLAYLNGALQSTHEFIVDLCLRGLIKDIDNSANKQKALNKLVSFSNNVHNDVFVQLCANAMAKKLAMSTSIVMQAISDGADNVDTKNNDNNAPSDRSSVPIPHNVSMGFSDVNIAQVQELYSKMLNHPFGAVELRLFALYVRYPGLIRAHGEPVFSVKIVRMMYEISKSLPANRKMVAEDYAKYSLLASLLFYDDNLFPSLHITNVKDIEEHYAYLLKRLNRLVENNKAKKEDEAIMAFLIANSGLSVKELAEKMKKSNFNIK